MEPDPLTKAFSVETLKRFGINPWRKKRDRWGRTIRNDNDYYQPEISSAMAIEHIYDPLNPICNTQCRYRCWEGQGRIASPAGIRRLNG